MGSCKLAPPQVLGVSLSVLNEVLSAVFAFPFTGVVAGVGEAAPQASWAPLCLLPRAGGLPWDRAISGNSRTALWVPDSG